MYGELYFTTRLTDTPRTSMRVVTPPRIINFTSARLGAIMKTIDHLAGFIRPSRVINDRNSRTPRRTAVSESSPLGDKMLAMEGRDPRGRSAGRVRRRAAFSSGEEAIARSIARNRRERESRSRRRIRGKARERERGRKRKPKGKKNLPAVRVARNALRCNVKATGRPERKSFLVIHPSARGPAGRKKAGKLRIRRNSRQSDGSSVAPRLIRHGCFNRRRRR